ncbi:MAG: superoxide dismutase [Bacteroidota bacterium]
MRPSTLFRRRSVLRFLFAGTAGTAALALAPGCASGQGTAMTVRRPGGARRMVPAGPGVAFDLATAAPSASSVYPYTLPDLPYAPDALGAAIDTETMRIHHGRHHQGYTNNLNRALEDYPGLQTRSLVDLLRDVSALPEAIRLAVLNNGGGYLNHALFWPMMRPDGGGTPTGALADAIDRDFGSLDALKQQMKQAATGVFGSGWAWLVRDGAGMLQVIQTTEQDPPHAFGFVPVLGVDVWEHAYYLRYQNRRGDYVDRWWSVVNWEQAARNFAA